VGKKRRNFFQETVKPGSDEMKFGDREGRFVGGVSAETHGETPGIEQEKLEKTKEVGEMRASKETPPP